MSPQDTREYLRKILTEQLLIREDVISFEPVDQIGVLIGADSTECKECRRMSVHGRICFQCGREAPGSQQRGRKQRFENSGFSSMLVSALHIPQLQASPIVTKSLEPSPISSPPTLPHSPNTSLLKTPQAQPPPSLANHSVSITPSQKATNNDEESIVTLAEKLLIPLPDLSFMLSRTLVIPQSFSL